MLYSLIARKTQKQVPVVQMCQLINITFKWQYSITEELTSWVQASNVSTGIISTTGTESKMELQFH